MHGAGETERPGRGPLLIVSAAALFGTTGTAQALGPPEADSTAVGLARLVIGGVALAVVAATRPQMRTTTPLLAVLVGAVAVLAYQLTFFAGVRASGVALGTVITIGSAPVFAGVLGRVVLSERPGRRWAIATAVAITGLVLVARPGSGAPLDGVVLNLAAGLSYAVFATASKRLVSTQGAVRAMALVFGTGAFLAAPLLAFQDLSFLSSPAGWASVGWLGLVATTLAYVLYGSGLRTTSVAAASTFILFEPVMATLLGVVVVGERPGAIAWLGMALIGAGLLGLARRSRVQVRTPV